MTVRWRRRFLNPAAHWRQESDPDAWRRRQFNRISTHLCGAGRQISLADLRAPAPGTSSSSRMNASSPRAWPKPCKTPAQLCLVRSRLSTRRSRKSSRGLTSTAQLRTSTLAGCLPTLSRTCSSPGRFLIVFTSGYRDNLLRDRYSQVKNCAKPICSRRWRKRWSRPCRSHDD
jgi:hypothetical protein